MIGGAFGKNNQTIGTLSNILAKHFHRHFENLLRMYYSIPFLKYGHSIRRPRSKRDAAAANGEGSGDEDEDDYYYDDENE